VLFSCASVFSFMASISYGLYVLHFPLLISWKEAHSLPGTVVACVMLLTLSYIAERQLPRILPKAPRD